MPPARVQGTVQASGRDDPVIRLKPRKRLRLTRLSSNRGANQGAPPGEALNVYPFPFQGMWSPARHGHHPVFGVGKVRRVGAWRAGGMGTMGGNRSKPQ